MTNRSAGRLWQEDHAMFYHQSMYLKAIEAVEAIEVIVKGQDGTNTRKKHAQNMYARLSCTALACWSVSAFTSS